jgi:hypothetical protein
MWRHCVEIIAFVLVAGAAIGAFVTAITVVCRAYKTASPLRRPFVIEPQKQPEHSDEYKKTLAEHWELWRKRMARYADDINKLVVPLRRDTLEVVKESANWGRLGVQYALIGNSGGLVVALPFVLSKSSAVHLSLDDANMCALLFILGFLSAAATCLVAYADFQLSAAIYWNDIDIEFIAARQRHFETADAIPTEPRVAMRNVLKAANTKISLCGVGLAAIAWIALAWGGLRLILSLTPT